MSKIIGSLAARYEAPPTGRMVARASARSLPMPGEQTPSGAAVTRFFDRAAPDWDKAHGPGSPRAGDFRARLALIRSTCRALGRPRALEAGCGTAIHLLHSADLISSGLGLDISPEMIKQARRNAGWSRNGHNVDLEVGDAAAMCPGQLGRFDLVLFTGALEHVECQRTVLAAARRLLAPQGVVLVVMRYPRASSMAGPTEVPLRHLSPGDLATLAARSGLRMASAIDLNHWSPGLDHSWPGEPCGGPSLARCSPSGASEMFVVWLRRP